MEISINGIKIDINDIKNVYPSAIVSLDGEKTPISLEWLKQYEDRVEVNSYAILIILKDSKKIELIFEDYNKMIENLNEIFIKLKNRK